MDFKIKPYEDLTEEEKIKYIDIGRRKEKIVLTEVQYYREELGRLLDEFYAYMHQLTCIEEGTDDPDFMWTKEQYEEIVNKYRERVKFLNRMFNK
jgi:hypothetical protein